MPSRPRRPRWSRARVQPVRPPGSAGEGPRRALQRGMASRRFTARLLVLAGVIGLGLGTTVSALRTEPFGVVVADGRPERLMDFASHRGLACAAWSGSLARGGGTSIYTLGAHLKAT